MLSSERFLRYAEIAYRYYVPVFIWMSVIFLLSAQPSLSIEGRHISLGHLLVRKSAHVFEYFILGFLSFRLFQYHFPKNSHIVAAGTVMLSLLFALSDEAHQLFVVGRQGKISDVGIDVFGIVCALAFCLVLMRKWRQRREEQ